MSLTSLKNNMEPIYLRELIAYEGPKSRQANQRFREWQSKIAIWSILAAFLFFGFTAAHTSPVDLSLFA
jgi:hypothetical protein